MIPEGSIMCARKSVTFPKPRLHKRGYLRLRVCGIDFTLGKPGSKQATERLNAIMAAWIADECHMHSQAVTRATELYTAYREWCKRTGHRAFTQNKFGRELESRGFRKEKPTHGEYRRAVVRHGIELAPINTN